jgi:hypothetical protein
VEIEEVSAGEDEETRTPPRAVFDANIYVAAYLSRHPRSPNKELFHRWRTHEFVLLISRTILEEIIEKFDERGIDQQLTIELISHILTDAEYVNVMAADVHAVIANDPDDDYVWVWEPVNLKKGESRAFRYELKPESNGQSTGQQAL